MIGTTHAENPIASAGDATRRALGLTFLVPVLGAAAQALVSDRHDATTANAASRVIANMDKPPTPEKPKSFSDRSRKSPIHWRVYYCVPLDPN